MSEEKRVTFSLEERDQRDNVSLAPVRLVGGRTDREGRLQVRERDDFRLIGGRIDREGRLQVRKRA